MSDETKSPTNAWDTIEPAAVEHEPKDKDIAILHAHYERGIKIAHTLFSGQDLPKPTYTINGQEVKKPSV